MGVSAAATVLADVLGSATARVDPPPGCASVRGW
jgi:hypothetical protein